MYGIFFMLLDYCNWRKISHLSLILIIDSSTKSTRWQVKSNFKEDDTLFQQETWKYRQKEITLKECYNTISVNTHIGSWVIIIMLQTTYPAMTTLPPSNSPCCSIPPPPKSSIQLQNISSATRYNLVDVYISVEAAHIKSVQKGAT